MPHLNFNSITLILTVACYVALITFQPSLQFMPNIIVWFMDKQRLIELTLLSFVLLHVSTTTHTISPFSKATRPIKISLIVLLILVCFSTLLAYSSRHAIIEVTTFIGLGYLSLIIAMEYQSNQKRLINTLTYILWASILLYLLSFYTGYISATITKKPLSWPQPFTGFSNIRSFNQYQLWSLAFLTLPLLCFELKKSTRIAMHIAIIIWWVLLFYSASRGVIIAWAGAILLSAILYRQIAWPFIKVQTVHLSLGFLSYLVLFKITPNLNQSTLITNSVTRKTTYDRLALWDQAILMIKTFPIFGAGPMHYAWYNETNGHPHNSILQLASEWGLPATIIVIGIGVYSLICWFIRFNFKQLQSTSNFNQSLSVILFFTVIANFAYSLVDGVIVMPISQVLMFTILGLMLGQYIKAGDFVPDRRRSTIRPIAATLTLILLVWSVYPEIRQGFSGDKKGFSMGHTAIGPRYWRETKVMDTTSPSYHPPAQLHAPHNEPK